MSTVSGASAPHQHPAYASLLDALADGGTLSNRQRRALSAVLASLAAAADLLASPDTGRQAKLAASPELLTAYRLGVASAPIDALRRELDALQYPHGNPDLPRQEQRSITTT